jgi:hypothetical protein
VLLVIFLFYSEIKETTIKIIDQTANLCIMKELVPFSVSFLTIIYAWRRLSVDSLKLNDMIKDMCRDNFKLTIFALVFSHLTRM